MPGVVQTAWPLKEMAPVKLETQPDGPALPPIEDAPVEPYVVVNQEVTLDINFRDKSIQGESKISIYCINADDPPQAVSLDARQCEIDVIKVTVNGKRVNVAYRDPYESLDIPHQWDLTPSNWVVWKNRMKGLAQRRRRDLPVEDREKTGCSPASGSLRISLRPPAPTQPQKPPKLKIRAPSSIESPTISAPQQGFFEIVIPFRTRHIRDGFQFVGVEESDSRYPHAYTRHSIEPGSASCIFPCVDDPGARCTWKIHIKCPRTLGDALHQPLASHQQSDVSFRDDRGGRGRVMSEEDKLIDMTVVCSGNLVGEKVDELDDSKKIMTFEINDHPAAAHHVGFAVGPFEHVDLWSEFRSEEADEKLGASALKIHGYCLPRRQDHVRNSCEALAHAADEFAMTYGRYPYDSYKICFVEDMVDDTVPLLGLSFCSSRLLIPEEIIDPEMDVTRALVHSLACQYFGVYIVPSRRTETWLTVGIAYYMTDLYLCRLCGNNDYRFRMKELADRLCDEDRGRPSLHDLGTYLHYGGFEMEFMALKAPLVLFILDKRLTKAAGSAGANLARVISKIISKANTSGWGDNQNEVISSESFIKICEKTSQYKLESFWKQWVYGSGTPSLNITQRFNKKQLCVDLTITQTQLSDSTRAQPIRKSEFWRELVEEQHHVFAGDVQHLFTGPMTIRIHEANGTPYEHTVEIREDAGKGVKFHIPYNTKYKRLKRNRRQRERAAAAAAAADPGQENQDEAIFFSLGDRLDSQQDMETWELTEWTEEDERKMDTESYEWIRIDSDFEWIFKTSTNLMSYMYTSQLQQDRDVVAQQDALLYLSRIREHAMCATILTRTLYDDRYFHGLRTKAADLLSRQTLRLPDKDGNHTTAYRGLAQLMRAFREFFCFPGTQTPVPNDFSDKRQYFVQSAIPTAISRVHSENKHPIDAQRFLLEQLRFNNNANNAYSDHIYVAKLLSALANSLTSTDHGSAPKKADEMAFTFDDDDDGDDSDEEAVDEEAKEILAQSLAEIERYRRMDEWTDSYQNIWTTTALDCKRKLMKAGVIPIDALEFVRYLQDGTLDLVQIKAFEALVDLGLMLRPSILRLLLCTMSTHPSPFMRDQLFKLFCEGLAAIAFGEFSDPEKSSETKAQQEEAENGLIIEQSDAIIKQNQDQHARREDIGTAMKALREHLKDDKMFQDALWAALNSPISGCAEKRNLLDLFDVLYETDESLLITVRYPTMWTVQREPPPARAILTFKRVPRPLRPPPPPPPPPPVELPAAAAPAAPVSATPAEPVTVLGPPEKKAGQPQQRIKIQTSKTLGTGPSTGGTPATPAPRQASISVATTPSAASAPVLVVPTPPPPPVADSIAVQPVHRAFASQSTAAASTAPPAGDSILATGQHAAVKAASSKRKRDDRETESPRPSKIIKLRVQPGYHKKLQAHTSRLIEMTPAMPVVSRADTNSIRAAAHSNGAHPRSSISSPRTLDESPSSATRGSSPKVPAPTSGGATGSKPARKPLPSGPSSTPVPAPAPAATTTTTPVNRPVKIKLKARPSQASPPG